MCLIGWFACTSEIARGFVIGGRAEVWTLSVNMFTRMVVAQWAG